MRTTAGNSPSFVKVSLCMKHEAAEGEMASKTLVDDDMETCAGEVVFDDEVFEVEVRSALEEVENEADVSAFVEDEEEDN